MSRLRALGVVRKGLRYRGKDNFSTARGPYRIRGSGARPVLIQTIGVEAAHLSVPVTMNAPLVFRVAFFQQTSAAHLAVPVTLFAPIAKEVVKSAHLSVPVTMFGPSLGIMVKAAHLAVTVTLRAPAGLTAFTTISPEHLDVDVIFYPPSLGIFVSYFTPPIEPFLKVPPLVRTDWLEEMHLGSGVPRSVKYRHFLATQMGKDITIDGVTYLGGRWNGPLTAQQISSITTAGYAARIVRVAEPGLLPAGID